MFTVNTDLAAGVEYSAIMRDMHPDEAYEIEAVHVLCASQIGTGIVHYLGLGRNTSGEEPGVIANEMTSKVGPFVHVEPDTEKAAGTSHYVESLVNFPTPIQFDENDKLNLFLYQGAVNITTWVFTLFYRLK